MRLIPRRIDALSNLGVVYARLGQYEPAIKNYQAALAVDPKGQVLVDKVFRNLNSAEAHLIIGAFSLARRQLQPAVDELKQAVRLDPKLPTAHSQLGVAYLLTGNRDLAKEEFRKELEVNPKDFIANTRLGWLMREDGKTEEAESLLRRALELRPDDPGPYFSWLN